MKQNQPPIFGPPAPVRLRLVAVESREEKSEADEVQAPAEGEANGNQPSPVSSTCPSNHPSRRPDGRSPNPHVADRAIADALDLPLETLEFLARHRST
ncbi:MAG: hypothetical protein JNK16_01790 [Phycisphaerales bacterium]|nr:hypothetical protein [Phycisphaerales bacterium]